MRGVTQVSDKSLTEMTDEEIIAEIRALRERRAQAQTRRTNLAKKPGEPSQSVRQKAILDDLFADDEEEKET